MTVKTKITTRTDRLRRLRCLRQMDAPLYIIRSEQVALCLTRKGLNHAGIGKPQSKAQSDLYTKFVLPNLPK